MACPSRAPRSARPPRHHRPWEGRFATIRPRHADRLPPDPPLRTLRLAGDGPDLLLRPPLPHLAAVVDRPRRKRAGAGPADHRRADRRPPEDGRRRRPRPGGGDRAAPPPPPGGPHPPPRRARGPRP